MTGKLYYSDLRCPLVVVDRNLLTFGRPEEVLPARAHIVLPDAYFWELMHGKAPDNEIERLNRWAKRHHEKVFISRYWDELSRMETSPTEPVEPREIINDELTHAFREAGKTTGLTLPTEDPTLADDEMGKEDRIVQFIGIGDQFAEWALGPNPTWQAELATYEARCEWVRKPDQVGAWIRRANERLRRPEWDGHLDVFPDRYAVCRWTRLLVWYALLRSLGHTKGRDNDYLDAEYAFAASYVGRIATRDHGLAQTVGAVFPDCEILGVSEEVYAPER